VAFGDASGNSWLDTSLKLSIADEYEHNTQIERQAYSTLYRQWCFIVDMVTHVLWSIHLWTLSSN